MTDDEISPSRRPERRAMGRRANREGSIDPFRDGWRGRIKFEGETRTVYGKTQAEVVRKLRELRRSVEAGAAPDVCQRPGDGSSHGQGMGPPTVT